MTCCVLIPNYLSPMATNAPLIYASLGQDEQQGWMSKEAPDCMFSLTDPYLQHILRSLAKIGVTDVPNEHIKWLYHWCGAYECIRTFNDSQLGQKNMLFSARVSFLQRVWGDAPFRPFDTADSSINHIKSSNTNFTVRLSTTRPGFITVTSRPQQNNFTHTRYQVLQNSYIVDSKGVQHQSISSLASTVSVST